MTDGDALRWSILADPADDTARLVYADWLEENGWSERAEFIRVQIELARDPTTGGDHTPHLECGCRTCGCFRRERELLNSCKANGSTNRMLWFIGLTSAFTRGFISQITCTATDWLAHADALAWHPGQTKPCPECEGTQVVGDGGRGGSLVCQGCYGSTGRIPRPCPSTAQPIERVTLTTRPAGAWNVRIDHSDFRFVGTDVTVTELDVYKSRCRRWGLPVGTILEGSHSLADILEAIWPGIEFRLPAGGEAEIQSVGRIVAVTPRPRFVSGNWRSHTGGMTTAITSARALADFSAATLAVFADNIHEEFESFAAGEWVQIEGNKWKSPGGRVVSDPVYQRFKGEGKGQAAAARPTAKSAPKAKAKPAARGKPGAGSAAKRPAAGKAAPVATLVPRPAAPVVPAPAVAAPLAAVPGFGAVKVTPRGTPIRMRPYKPGGYAPPTPETPPPPPAATAYIDQTHAKDTRRFGARAAGVLRDALHVLTRGALATLGAVGGAAIGGAAGFGLSGGNPLGALGGAIGGGVLGARSLMGVPRELQSIPRLRAGVRKVARAVVPKIAGVAAGTPEVALGVAAPAALGGVGGLLGGPYGLGAGLGAGMVTGGMNVAAGLEHGSAAASAVRRKMATSDVSRRKAERHSERFADAPAPDPVKLIRARLAAIFARLGRKSPSISDAQIQAALAGSLGLSPTVFADVHYFGWDDWRPEGEWMVSPGGRKLTLANWERLKAASKRKAFTPKPAAKGKPAKAGRTQSPTAPKPGLVRRALGATGRGIGYVAEELMGAPQAIASDFLSVVNHV